LAGNYPERFTKLILASAVSKKWLSENDKVFEIANKIFNPFSEKLTWGLIRMLSGIFPRLIAESFYPNFTKNLKHNLTKKDILELIKTIRKFRSKKGFINDINQNIDDNIIQKIECPTLIIHSESDNIVPIEFAKYSNSKIKNFKLEVLNNEWGHLFWIGDDSKNSITKTINFIEE